MPHARCSCGALALTLEEPAKMVIACHCLDCQRRTGAPFGVGAFYADEAVTIAGISREYVRDAISGGRVRNYFCPTCGTTVFWRADNLPSMIVVAVGAIADPHFPGPSRSIFEQSRHAWLHIGGEVGHFPQGNAAKKSS